MNEVAAPLPTWCGRENANLTLIFLCHGISLNIKLCFTPLPIWKTVVCAQLLPVFIISSLRKKRKRRSQLAAARAHGRPRRLILSVEVSTLSDSFRGHHIWSTAVQLSVLSLI